MYILAAETSTKRGSVALSQDGTLLGEVENLVQKSHSEVLHSFIDQLLRKNNLKISDIDIFASSTGPGSFTGLRIAGNAMKTFAFIMNKPMVAIDSLTLLAAGFPEDGIITPWINAYKNMVYFARFEKKNGELKVLEAPSAKRVQDLELHLDQKSWIVGDGYEVYHQYLSEKLKKNCLRLSTEALASGYDYPKASTLVSLAFPLAKKDQTIDWKSYKPLYIRASEAEENKSGVIFSSLK
ncbi:MAG: tRNA (adenosine(37)-N6)-threonylcarbamoyltransferase complex dimerization subunit type 1 TsaB [Bdellovibrionota bacterium]